MGISRRIHCLQHGVLDILSFIAMYSVYSICPQHLSNNHYKNTALENNPKIKAMSILGSLCNATSSTLPHCVSDYLIDNYW